MVGTRFARMCLPHLVPGNNRVLNNSLNLFDFISMACSDRFNLEHIDEILLPSLYEVLAEREGLLPGQECTFTIHELVHVFQDIKELGPPRCYWMYSAERLNKYLKNLVRNPRSPYESMVKNYAWNEMTTMFMLHRIENMERMLGFSHIITSTY